MTAPALILCQCGERVPDEGNSHYDERGNWLHYHAPKGGDGHDAAGQALTEPGETAATDGPLPDDGRPEKAVQAAIKRVLHAHPDIHVYDLSQPRAAMQTPGIPDIYVMTPTTALWVEVKRSTGTLSEAQEAFRARCTAAGAPWACWRHERDAERFVRSLKPVAPSSTRTYETIINLLEEIIEMHADPADPWYNECEKTECEWCRQARESVELLRELLHGS